MRDRNQSAGKTETTGTALGQAAPGGARPAPTGLRMAPQPTEPSAL
jgi:hypothetical protein